MTAPTDARMLPCRPSYRRHEEHLAKVHSWPHGHLTIDEVVKLVEEDAAFPTRTQEVNKRRRGIRTLLGWLETFPADTWQARWEAAGCNGPLDWIDEHVTATDPRSAHNKRADISSALRSLLLNRVLLPDYVFLSYFKNNALATDIENHRSPEAFARLAGAAEALLLTPRQWAEARTCVITLMIRTGQLLERLSCEDFYEYRAELLRHRRHAPDGMHAAWEALRKAGLLETTQTLRQALRHGQLTCADMVDRYPVRTSSVRDAFVRYLEERRTALDYSSLRSLAGVLVDVFWCDIEQHHPEVDSLHLTTETARAWKQRVRSYRSSDASRTAGGSISILMKVRSFYLDIQEWALEDPYWSVHAAPSPVRRGEGDGIHKQRAHATARMHQRVRERLPMLPDLVAAAERHKLTTAQHLEVARNTPIDDPFEYNGAEFRRVGASGGSTAAPPIQVVDLTSGHRLHLDRAEDDAFWAWAVIETLRHTGIRIEEMLELTHLALTSYTLPNTAEVVPLLQVVPSKTNEERLLLVSPELAGVLAQIISRLRNRNSGAIPTVPRYDNHEAITGPPLPHLFQRRTGPRVEVMTAGTVRKLLATTLRRAGVLDSTGVPLQFTPHDFRRMFVTEAVSNGLPVHIAAKVLGHRNLNTTQAYLAVFHNDLLNSYRQFLQNRRAVRPAAEYRQPTDTEWAEFNDHFELRQVALGTCARPYGTPCRHEHACVRCPVLRVDPAQRPRLAALIHNLVSRIDEARAFGWRGEIDALTTSLDAATRKLAELDRSERPPQTNLGLPGWRLK